MTDSNGIFTVSDLAGTDPHSYWITGLPHAEQPHVWEQPQQDWLAHDNQVMLNQLLFDAQIDRLNRDIAARGPVVADPNDPSTWHLPTQREANDRAAWQSFQFNHPFRAWLIRVLSL